MEKRFEDLKDNNAAHLTGDESIDGNKKFLKPITVTDGVNAVKVSPTSIEISNGNLSGKIYLDEDDGIYLISNLSIDYTSIANRPDAASIVYNKGNQTINGNLTANQFVGDGSKLTNLPTSTSSVSISDFPEFSVSVDGAQSISLPVSAKGVVEVQVLESTGYVRNVYRKYMSIASGTLSITADANIKNGDKIAGCYY